MPCQHCTTHGIPSTLAINAATSENRDVYGNALGPEEVHDIAHTIEGHAIYDPGIANEVPLESAAAMTAATNIAKTKANPVAIAPQHQHFIALLRAFAAAGHDVAGVWDTRLLEKTRPHAYPAYLPSFDDFLTDLETMAQRLELAAKKVAKRKGAPTT